MGGRGKVFRTVNLRPIAILFDMDGTLTVPMLDFPKIKRDMGIPVDQPILEALARMNDDERRVAEAVLLYHEDHAAEHATLNQGCRELLEWLDRCGIRAAVVTRNSRRSTDIVIKSHALPFDVLITRDEGVFKPSPRPLQLACERLGVSVDQAWMVGDGSHDIDAAAAAGMTSVWVNHGKMRSFASAPTMEVRDLIELLNVLRDAAE
jgi:HAD superfamily hydrolase (TIGR01509 family)